MFMDKNGTLEAMLQSYKAKIEANLEQEIASFGSKSKLRDAVHYALLNGGKRFRPAIVLMIANQLGNEQEATQAALAIEYFHTASLIADDLPCMDNDDERRGKASTHCVFGEDVALLATYALISAGYQAIQTNVAQLRAQNPDQAASWDRVGMIAMECASINTGIHGATGGQYLDTCAPVEELDLEMIMEKKTVTLFDISFVFGWLFGGGDVTKVDAVKSLARHFGLAFQIADDLDDLEQDREQGAGKNYALVHGVDQALAQFKAEVTAFEAGAKELNLYSKQVAGLVIFLQSQVSLTPLEC
jgi:geranylgeranyl diphosphate synthase type II